MSRELRIGLGASALLHAATIAILLMTGPVPTPPPGETIVHVTIDRAPPPPGLVEALPSPEAPPSPAPLEAWQDKPQAAPSISPETQPAPAAPPEEDANTVVAKEFYATAVLARSQNRSALEALKTLSPAERREQICDTEAMEQLHRWRHTLRPDRLIAYALGDTQLVGDTLKASGAAFRSNHQWFALSFECKLDATDRVVGFRFSMGAAIAHDRWSDLLLER